MQVQELSHSSLTITGTIFGTHDSLLYSIIRVRVLLIRTINIDNSLHTTEAVQSCYCTRTGVTDLEQQSLLRIGRECEGRAASIVEHPKYVDSQEELESSRVFSPLSLEIVFLFFMKKNVAIIIEHELQCNVPGIRTTAIHSEGYALYTDIMLLL